MFISKFAIPCLQVVFRGGEGALQVLPQLVDVIPEARLNLVIYYLKQGTRLKVPINICMSHISLSFHLPIHALH